MIIPALLEKDWENLQKKLEICREFASWVHIDFIDGKLAPNTTFMDFTKFSAYSNYFNLEAHLMVEDPANYLASLSRVGFKRFLGHVEKMPNQVDFVAKGEEYGAVGLALDIETPIENIEVPLNDLDQILLMGVKAGFSGQKFNEKVLPKIQKLFDQSFNNIEIDGGINNETLPLIQKAGASDFCVTSYIFGSSDPQHQFRILEGMLSGGNL